MIEVLAESPKSITLRSSSLLSRSEHKMLSFYEFTLTRFHVAVINSLVVQVAQSLQNVPHDESRFGVGKAAAGLFALPDECRERSIVYKLHPQKSLSVEV